MEQTAESRNTWMLQFVAEQLGPLKDEVVFLGGAVIPFLLTAPHVPMTRFTKDIDIIFDPDTREALFAFEDELRDRGFKKCVNAAVCQWVVNNVYIDVLPSDPEVIGFDNRWCAEAEQHAIRVHIGNGMHINVVPGHCFLGLKLSAFLRRGKRNYVHSYDIADLLLVLGGRDEIEKEVQTQASPPLKKFIIGELKNIHRAVNGSPGKTLQAFKGDRAHRKVIQTALERIENIIEAK